MCLAIWEIVSQCLTLKKGLMKLCRKSLALPEFGQLQSDRSISNLMMSHWSIKESRLVLITSGNLMAKNSGKNGH